TVNRDSDGIADKVQTMVDAVNKLKDAITEVTKYDPSTNQGSPLTGDSSTRRLVTSLQDALSSAVPWANPGSPGLAGVTVDKDGTYAFDRAKCSAAFAADPDGLARVFTQGGSATDPSVSFVSAGDKTRYGNYAVAITQAATQAHATGLAGSYPIPSPPTVRVK